MEKRATLLRQGKYFHWEKTEHMAKDCPPEQEQFSKQEKVDLARFAYTTIKALMSTPDTLPMEIALITLLLFKFQVYLTFLHHYYHRLITLSMFRLLHQSTIHHMASINALQLPLKKFFCPQDWHLTHTVQPHTALATQSLIAATSLDFYQFS
jgi:hypothetical protein